MRCRLSVLLSLSVCILSPLAAYGEAAGRWRIGEDGRSIVWTFSAGDSHFDHIEMSGMQVSSVLRYGVGPGGRFSLDRSMVWPMLRTLPNNTHASLMRHFAFDPLTEIGIDGYSIEEERVQEIVLDGTLRVRSLLPLRNGKGSLELGRVIFPSTTLPALCELYVLKNASGKEVMADIPTGQTVTRTIAALGVSGSYTLTVSLYGGGSRILAPGDSLEFYVAVTGCRAEEQAELPDVRVELVARKRLVDSLQANLVLETPDSVLNAMFALAKIRAAESIYRTSGGLMHGPGGESYYAAVWANDQAEYINPFFPFLGYAEGNESALNAFRLFSGYMNDGYRKLPSSIIAEGTDIWDGAGDRGDAAMIAYGACRYALARGDRQEAEQLWPLVEWCLEYCRLQLNEEGVVRSDTDELEGRFPSGEANLCTSSLYYDALNSAVYLGKELDIPYARLNLYRRQARDMRKNIERYFGAEVEGFGTYRYYDGNDVLRSWICIPLTVGIYDRKEGTVDALFSPRLWTGNGLLTEAGDGTYWDRSTLYAFRGAFACGDTERTLTYLRDYSEARLLGDHVPYPVEAWPEGNQRHLSAESGLYCRIYTEGLFGIRPTGFRSFEFTPRLPPGWDRMALRRIRAFGSDFDILVERTGTESGSLRAAVLVGGCEAVSYEFRAGDVLEVTL